jgi:hypothetical protein
VQPLQKKDRGMRTSGRHVLKRPGASLPAQPGIGWRHLAGFLACPRPIDAKIGGNVDAAQAPISYTLPLGATLIIARGGATKMERCGGKTRSLMAVTDGNALVRIGALTMHLYGARCHLLGPKAIDTPSWRNTRCATSFADAVAVAGSVWFWPYRLACHSANQHP